MSAAVLILCHAPSSAVLESGRVGSLRDGNTHGEYFGPGKLLRTLRAGAFIATTCRIALSIRSDFVSESVIVPSSKLTRFHSRFSTSERRHPVNKSSWIAAVVTQEYTVRLFSTFGKCFDFGPT